MTEEQDIVREFLLESNENLSRLDNELVDLEQRPKDSTLLGSIFRTVHTIKGTCGFLGFTTLEAITHEAETILGQLRGGERELTRSLVSLVLEVVDATRAILRSIETTQNEGPERYEDLIARLREVSRNPQPASGSEGAAIGAGEQGHGEAATHPTVADTAIRVDVGLLDKLMNLVGELVLARNQIVQHSAHAESRTPDSAAQRLSLITAELQENVMKTRMQPIGVVWNNLPRVVRDIAAALGKQVRLEMEGAATGLDKTIIEAIKAPLTHLVRNCCDHGIETPQARVEAGKPAQGKILLRAFHEGGQVIIEICDDGAGMDPCRIRKAAVDKGFLRAEQAERLNEREALHLIFCPGFSTASAVSNVSGRGVGMDVVKTNIEKIGGQVEVASRAGEGTTIRLRIPLTLAIIPGLIVTSGGERFVIPQASLLDLIRLEGEEALRQIEHVHGSSVFRWRGRLLPIALLNDVLELEAAPHAEAVNLIVLQAEERQFGLVVDCIIDTQEIVVKPLDKQLKELALYAGATIMGDGGVALILDVAGVGMRAGMLSAAVEEAREEENPGERRRIEAERLLLLRCGGYERLAVPMALVARLEEIPRCAVEHAAGQPVVQYRGQILPLVSLAEILDAPAGGISACRSAMQADPLQIVVFRNGARLMGVAVDQIVDIVEEKVCIRRQSARKGLLGSAVVGGRIADILDMSVLARTAGDKNFEQQEDARGSITVLLAEGEAFARGLLRAALQMAGYQIIEAGSADEVLDLLERMRADILLCALNLPPQGGYALLDAVRRKVQAEALPALALTAAADRSPAGEKNRQTDFEEYQPKFDWDGIAGAIARLTSAARPAGVPAEAAAR